MPEATPPCALRQLPGMVLPFAPTVAIFEGAAEYIALWFKGIGHESAFYAYVTGCIDCSLPGDRWMADMRTHPLIAADLVGVPA